MASERESKDRCKFAIPALRSWYVALGWTTDRNVFGSNDFEDIKMAASYKMLRLAWEVVRVVREMRTLFHIHLGDAGDENRQPP